MPVGLHKKSFTYRQGYSVRVASGAVDTQLVRMPWASPVQRPGYLVKMLISNPVGTAGRLDIWDQDLTSTTPPTAGSLGAALYPLEFAASATSGAGSKTTIYTEDQLPRIPIIGGLNSQSTQPGVTAVFEIEYL